MAPESSPFRIRSLITETARFRLFDAECMRDSERVVIKQAASADRDGAALRREHQMSALLAGLPVRTVIGATTLEGAPALVFAALDAVTLRTWSGTPSRSPEDRLQIALNIAAALGACHDAGVTHGNLGPDCIFVGSESGEIHLADLAFATLQAHETMDARHPSELPGALSYMAPERTGRLRRTTDRRADLYSLGATLFELFVGQPPFTSSVPLELVQSHIARPAPDLTGPAPAALAPIIATLLAKRPENRYQDARTLIADLERVLEAERSGRSITDWTGATHASATRFCLPTESHGRAPQRQQLFEALERVRNGASDFILLSGESGSGKRKIVSSLIGRSKLSEFVSLTIPSRRDHGPYEQPKLLSAFAPILRALHDSNAPGISARLDRIVRELGSAAPVLIDALPELSPLFDHVGPLPALPPIENEQRFELAFLRLIRGIASKASPLLLVLEDIEHLDADSMSRLELITGQAGVPHLLIIGTTDQPDAALERLSAALHPDRQHHLKIDNLDHTETAAFIADTLQLPEADATELSRVLMPLCNGNPQRILDALEALRVAGILRYHRDRSTWDFDSAAVQAGAALGDTLGGGALQPGRLNPECAELLTTAAVFGTRFELDLLVAAQGLTLLEGLRRIRAAVDAGLVAPLQDAIAGLAKTRVSADAAPSLPRYRFSRDAVHAALYARIADPTRAQLHERIGRLLIDHGRADSGADASADSYLREGVVHLNAASQLDPRVHADIQELARLNLLAGRSALLNAQPQGAFRFLRTGLGLMGQDAWSEHPQTAYGLCVAAMEAATLCGDPTQVERLGRVALTQVSNPSERLDVASLMTRALYNSGRTHDAATIAVPALQAVGHAPEMRYPGWLILSLSLRRGRRLLRIIEQPGEDHREAASPTSHKAVVLLMELAQGSFHADNRLLLGAVYRILDMGITHDNIDGVPFSLACVGALCALLGLRDDALRYRRAVDRLLAAPRDTSNSDPRAGPRTRLVATSFIQPWLESPSRLLTPLVDIQQQSLALGDAETSGLAASVYASLALIRGQDTQSVRRELTAFAQTLDIFQSAPGMELLAAYGAFMDTLQDGTGGNHLQPILDDLDDASSRTTTAHVHLLGAWSALLEERPREALTLAAAPIAAEMTRDAGYVGAQYNLVVALAQLDAARSERGWARWRRIRAARGARHRIDTWISHGLVSLRHRSLLIRAEEAALRHRFGRTFDLFERAIREARANGFNHDEAMAWERCARFLSEHGRHEVARRFRDGALECWRRVGAHSCIARLERVSDERDTTATAVPWPQGASAGTPASAPRRRLPHGDVLAAAAELLEATRSITREVGSEALVGTLFERLLDSELATRVALVRSEDEQLELFATADGETAPMVKFPGRLLVDSADELPVSAVQFVARTRRSLLLADPRSEDVFTQDPYVLAHQPSAIACVPLLVADRITGILYAEHGERRGRFGADELQFMEMLAAQAAIGIDNARLFDALAKARDEYRALFENAVEGIFKLGLDGRLLIANESLAHALGYRNANQLMTEVSRLPRDVALEPEGIEGIVDAVIEHGAVRDVEFEAFRRDGTRIWLEVSARSILDDEGNPAGIEGSLVDVTERRDRQLAEQAREVAEGATRAKSYFLASMSHEIRTPMNAILGFSELALGTELSARQQEYVGTIHDAARSLLDIINDILDLSRIEAGRMELVLAPIELPALFQQLEALFGTRARERGIAFHCSGADIVSAALAADAQLQADPGRLRQVLLNLIDNAIKFTSDGRVELEVTPTAVDANAVQLRFSVRDTGIGIAAEDQQRLFESFEQLDAGTTRRHAGTGLGLAICRDLVVLMGGELDLISTPGVGSCFSFEIIAPVITTEHSEVATSGTVNGRPLLGRRLLLAEDNRMNQQLALEFLESAGARVIVAETGVDVLDLVAQQQFDAILMDLHMPELDGIEACVALRRLDHGRTVPVIAVTADAIGDGLERARAAGFDGFVLKPVDRSTLIGELLHYLPVAAPSGQAPDTPSEPLAPMPALAGFDLAVALRNHNGNTELFTRMIGDFQHYYGDAGKRLRDLLDANRDEEAARLAHNLHGVAGSFGAERLRLASADLERAIETERPYLDRRLTSCEQALAEALTSAAALSRGDVSLQASS